MRIYVIKFNNMYLYFFIYYYIPIKFYFLDFFFRISRAKHAINALPDEVSLALR